MLRQIVFMAAMLNFTVSAEAKSEGSHAFFDGNDLYAMCGESGPSDGRSLIGFWVCQSYIQGAFDMFAGARAEQNLTSCLPPGVNAMQLSDTVRQYLKENPASRHLGAHHLVARAVVPLLVACSQPVAR